MSTPFNRMAGGGVLSAPFHSYLAAKDNTTCIALIRTWRWRMDGWLLRKTTFVIASCVEYLLAFGP